MKVLLPDLVVAAVEVVEVEDVLPVSAAPCLQVRAPVPGRRRPLQDSVERDGRTDNSLPLHLHQLSCLLK